MKKGPSHIYNLNYGPPINSLQLMYSFSDFHIAKLTIGFYSRKILECLFVLIRIGPPISGITPSISLVKQFSP